MVFRKAGFASFLLVVFLLVAVAGFAHSGETEIAEGKGIVESGVSCDNLSDEQLEAVGEYLMELMHPGDLHELMHERMGILEDAEYHERFHVNLAQSMYCGDRPMAGMMGMMGWWNDDVPKFGWGRQMMGAGGMMGAGYGGNSYGTLTSALYVALLVGIIGLVYFWLYRLWKGGRKGRR
ncbi:hypothetical protein HYU18_01755 [Candidatus Woesearchaeota archaeon]|nr:hypothetical protein [Candidatus Woesearchaeota archaeon]